QQVQFSNLFIPNERKRHRRSFILCNEAVIKRSFLQGGKRLFHCLFICRKIQPYTLLILMCQGYQPYRNEAYSYVRDFRALTAIINFPKISLAPKYISFGSVGSLITAAKF